MVYQHSLDWEQSLSDGEGLLDRLMSTMRKGGKLTDLLDTASILGRNFLDLDRVEILKFTADSTMVVVASSSNCANLPPNCGQQYPAYYLPDHRREFLLKHRQQISIDLQHHRTIAYSIQTTTVGTATTQQHYSEAVPQIFDREYLNLLKAWGLVSCLIIPIIHHNRLWGLFCCQHSQSKRFDRKQLQTLQPIVDLLSLAIAQSQLVAHAQLHSQQEQVVQRISAMLHSNRTDPGIEPELLAEICRALGADGGRLLILAEPLAQRAQIFTYGVQPSSSSAIEKNLLWQKILYAPTNSTQQYYQSLAPTIEQAEVPPPSQTYRAEDIYQQPLLAPLFPAFQSAGIHSLLILPLRYSHQCVGCLTLFRVQIERVWTNSELQLAQSLAMHLYLAMMQKRVEYMFRHHAYYDRLTGLPNRLLLHQKLTLNLAQIQSANEVLAVIFLDLDRFKTINDSLGHTCGDLLLKLVAQRLKDTLGMAAIVGRWSGDEFTILIPKLSNIDAVRELAERILNCLDLPFEFAENFPTLKTNLLYIKASMGIAIAPLHGQDSETLLKHADAALYRAKHNGKNNYEIYTTANAHTATDRLRLENILYQAIEKQQLLLHYQPQIDLNTGRVIGIEALLRCQDRHGKLISPAEFIPIAEETGLIDQIGAWVIRAACHQNQRWQELGLGSFPIAVNLSVRQLQEQNLIDTITTILTETGLPPAQLEVEITESIAIKDLDLTIAILECLRGIGVKISLDDFGTGYSSLASLKYLPLDRLKIDRSFIRELRANTVDAGIVKTIVNLGHELDLYVIAEGVETAEQLQFLQSINCDAVQGFLFSRPLLATDLEPLIIQSGYWHQNLADIANSSAMVSPWE